MAYLNIIKSGITNVVDEVQFEKIYKPQGWTIDNQAISQETEQSKTVTELKDDTKIKNYNKMKQAKDKVFDDGLLKKDK